MKILVVSGPIRGLALALVAALAGCAAEPTLVATDVKVVEKPVPVPCKVEIPAPPMAHVALVQLSGVPMVDLVPIWRAAEAELEERIAYEIKLEAALKACVAPP
jgi:hypothetical protein